MTIYLQDGASTSHRAWSVDAIANGVADGVIISPFFTPRTPRRGHPAAATLATDVRVAGGAVLLDATTHGVGLPGASYWTSYNTWDLWEGARGDLSTDDLVDAHVNRVFERQDELDVQHLAPTVALDSAAGADADTALALADAARRADAGTWHSLAGRRGLWLSEDLDAHVGALAQLRAPVWLITVIRERMDYPPDLTEIPLSTAVARTVHSLSSRSRVIVCHADLAGLPLVAAGAEAIGTGWHTKHRVCAPATYQANDPDNVRRQALWLTYQGLVARLHETHSSILTRADAARAANLYPGAPVATRAAARVHHLAVVRALVDAVHQHGDDRRARVTALREIYELASAELESLGARYGREFARYRATQVEGAYEGLRAYASAEGLWAP